MADNGHMAYGHVTHMQDVLNANKVVRVQKAYVVRQLEAAIGLLVGNAVFAEALAMLLPTTCMAQTLPKLRARLVDSLARDLGQMSQFSGEMSSLER